MAQVTIVYWRDMPAQVISGRGRRAAKAPLPERFEQAIDRAAMRCGAAGTDDYLAGFRKSEPVEVEGGEREAAGAEAARIDAEYDAARLARLVEGGGRERD